MSNPTCKIDGCPKKLKARGWCAMHYQRWQKTGETGTVESTVTPNIGHCAVDGCGQPMRKKQWCNSHYAQWQREGEVRPFKYKWGRNAHCDVCAQPIPAGSYRRYCSAACRVLNSRNAGVTPTEATCHRCGDTFSLFDTSAKSGRKKRADSYQCNRCKAARSVRHKTSPHVLAKRDGTSCTICGEKVDMSLKKPDLFRASVDHVIPWSLGGTNDPENLALAHLWCNQVKHNRTGWTMK